MTLGSDHVIGQINNQLLKLIDVVSIVDLTEGDHIERELLLLKLRVEDERTGPYSRTGAAGRCAGAGRSAQCYTVELTGAATRIDDLINRAAAHAEILAVVRSGPLAVGRGDTGPQVS